MKYQYLLFDLDGTLTDPVEGITNCLNYALKSFNFPTHAPAQLAQFIGPPLDQTFGELVGAQDKGLISALVAKYRERYADVGYKENVIYPDIKRVLTQLDTQSDVVMGVCTSKRADFAQKILELFEISGFFRFVSGGDVGIAKSDQIAGLLKEGAINKSALMIGDRHFDLAAAESQAIDGAGVLWGYGSRDELSSFNPEFLFRQPNQLLTALL